MTWFVGGVTLLFVAFEYWTFCNYNLTNCQPSLTWMSPLNLTASGGAALRTAGPLMWLVRMPIWMAYRAVGRATLPFRVRALIWRIVCQNSLPKQILAEVAINTLLWVIVGAGIGGLYLALRRAVWLRRKAGSGCGT